MTSVLNLLDPNERVETLQLFGGFHRNDRRVSEDDENGDCDCAHQPAKVRVGRHQDLKRAHTGLKSRSGQQLEELR